MKILQGIAKPVPGERVLRTVPELLPYVQDANGAPLRKRLNLFAQRALTHVALTDEQRGRIAETMLLGRSVAPGVIDGFEVALSGTGDAADLVLMPGHAIAPDGADIELGYALRVPFRRLPVIAPQVDEALRQLMHAEGRDFDRLGPLERLISIEGLAKLGRLALLPHAMVLVALPRTVLIDDRGALDSPCPNATGEDPFSALAWEDGFLLAWVPWPQDASLPPWSTDGGASVDTRFRNRLAYAVFNNERERATPAGLRSLRAWTERQRLSEQQKAELTLAELAAQARARPWPWEQLGVALALVGFDAAHHPVFADRGSVVRQGGGRPNRSALVPRSGEDVLWQARIAQFIEQLAEMAPEARSADQLARQFDWLPPAGVLPKDAADLLAGRQSLFPPGFDVEVQPVPLDMVDALLAESAPLLPFNLSLGDQVQLLVPVPSRFYEPNVLKLDETIHPLFNRETARLERARLDLLSQRDALRRRFDVLSAAVTGALPAYPHDDPNALPDETGALDAAGFARVHVSAPRASQPELHGFFGAGLRLALESGDALIVFVRIDTPPADIRVELYGNDVSIAPLVWGARPDAGESWMGELPPTGEWTRLTIPLADLKLSRASLNGMRFTLHPGPQGGRATWGYAGKLGNGFETYWLSDAIPPGAVTEDPAPQTAARGGDWTWETQGTGAAELDDTRFGLPLGGATRDGVQRQDVRMVAELDNLVSGWLRSPGGLVRELGVPWPAVDRNGAKLDANGNPIPADSDTPQHIAPPEQPPLIAQGLDPFITRIAARISAAGDHVEFGFLRARTDIYRVRQSVLGTQKAGQLLTSPSASELIERSASIAATEKDFDDYFARAKDKAVEAPPAPVGPAAPPVQPATPAGAGRTFSAAAVIRTPGVFRATSLLSPASLVRDAPLDMVMAADLRPVARTAAGLPLAAPSRIASAALVKESLALPTLPSAPTVGDVVGSSLFAATFNTVTVGKRLEGAASVETKNAAATGKTGFVTNSLTLLQTNGVALDGIDVYGFRDKDAPGDPDPSKAISAAGALRLLHAGKLFDFDSLDPPQTDQHEAGYFKRGLEAIDSMVRFLRGVELRGEDYRRLQNDAISARGRIVQVLQRLQSMIDSLSARLAEVRHDLSVARALRAEEQARVDALIARRRAILAEQVPYLVFRRPRVANVRVDTAVLPAQPALIDDPVPRCREQHPDLPPELQAMVDTLKDVPARWFRRSVAIFSALDRVEHLQRVVEVARERLGAQAPRRPMELVEGPGTKTGTALVRAFAQHEARIATAQQTAMREIAQFQAVSVKSALEPLRRLVALGDLIRAAPPARGPSLSAAGLLDDVAGVATCLYAAFGAVPPATRLIWAERFSELDPAFSLRSLTVLPDFGNEALGVDYIAWRGMQSMVDWLFANVEDDPDAVAAMNDLVRVCLLLSAHAPVKRIIDARVVRPVRPLPGARLDLAIDPRLARVGMQVLVHAPATHTVIARAVIEDIAADGARASITQVMTAGITIDASSRVQLQSGPPLSTPAKQAADERQAAGVTTTPARAGSGIEAQAESRLGKQVEALGRTIRLH